MNYIFLQEIVSNYDLATLKLDIKEDNIKYYNRIINKYERVVPSYYKFFKTHIINHFKDYQNTIGLDYGCWIGLSTLTYSLYNNSKIYSCDFYEKNILNSFFKDIRKKLNNKSTEIEYFKIKKETISLNFDWIMMYDVLCEYNISNNPILGDIQIKNKLEEENLLDLTIRLKNLYNILNKNGILLITDMENNKGISLKEITKIIKSICQKYKIIFVPNSTRYIIKCYK